MNKLKILILVGLFALIGVGSVLGSYPFGYDIGMNGDDYDEIVMDA